MAKNKMANIAEMFGKKFGEEFFVQYQVSKYKWVVQPHAMFTEKGLMANGKNKDVILRQLLTDKAVIIPEIWI